MPSSATSECCDCNEHFCLTCEEGEHCPDCGLAMCDDCRSLADDERRGRCYQCDDPEVGQITFGRDRRSGRVRDNWLKPREGKLRD